MDQLRERVELIIENVIRPKLKGHFGDIECTHVESGIVTVKLLGACRGCPSAKETLEDIVLADLQSEIPEIHQVVLNQEISADIMDFARQLLNRD